MHPERALDIAESVAGALDEAHRNSLVHRDVKPGNVLLAPTRDRHRSEHVYLTDFGIARSLGQELLLTRPVVVLGSPAYMAPERLAGEPGGPGCDVYGLACVLYECFTGQRPWPQQAPPEEINRRQMVDPPRLRARRPDLPRGLDEALRRAMDRDPRQRPATAGDLAAACRSAFRSGSFRPRPADPSVPPPAGRGGRPPYQRPGGLARASPHQGGPHLGGPRLGARTSAARTRAARTSAAPASAVSIRWAAGPRPSPARRPEPARGRKRPRHPLHATSRRPPPSPSPPAHPGRGLLVLAGAGRHLAVDRRTPDGVRRGPRARRPDSRRTCSAPAARRTRRQQRWPRCPARHRPAGGPARGRPGAGPRCSRPGSPNLTADRRLVTRRCADETGNSAASGPAAGPGRARSPVSRRRPAASSAVAVRHGRRRGTAVGEDARPPVPRRSTPGGRPWPATSRSPAEAAVRDDGARSGPPLAVAGTRSPSPPRPCWRRSGTR